MPVLCSCARIRLHTLTTKGETKIEEEVGEENYIRRECHHGAFSRSVAIPVSIMPDEAEAEYENGPLTLTLPKAEEAKPKPIEIRVKWLGCGARLRGPSSERWAPCFAPHDSSQRYVSLPVSAKGDMGKAQFRIGVLSRPFPEQGGRP